MNEIRYLQYGNKTKVPYRDFDKTYKKLDDLLEDRAVMLPRLIGNWKIGIIDAHYDDLVRSQTFEVPEYMELTMYGRPELLQKLKLGESFHRRSLYEEYVENYLRPFPKLLSDDAADAIFRRCHGDTDRISYVFEELEAMPAEAITLREVDSLLPNSETASATDVLMSMFIYSNRHVPRKGNCLSGYRWRPPIKQAFLLIDQLGEEIVFYALRKRILRYIKLKKEFNKGIELKNVSRRDTEFLQVVDSDSLIYAYCLFLQSKPSSLLAILYDIIARQRGDGEEEERLYAHIFRG